MSQIFQYDPKYVQKTTYTKKECLQILETLLYQRDRIDTFGMRFRQLGLSLCRLFSKNLFSQKLETPIPPRQWIVQMIALLDEIEESDLSNKLRSSDAYRKIWQSAAGLSLESPYWGKWFCVWDFLSFLANVKVDSPDEVGLNPTTCSAGAIPWDFTPEEKEEVINHIRSLGPQYQNSTVILDKSDIPEDLLDQVSFADRDEDEVRNASRQFLSNLRRHREIQNQNPQLQY